MAKLTFKNADILSIIKHAADNSEAGAAIMLVKDDGIYIMADTTPRQLKTEGEVGAVVAYAKGYNPKTDSDDVWEKCRNAVGGDDFAEGLTLGGEMVTAILEGADLSVNVTASSISMEVKQKQDDGEIRDWLSGVLADNVVGYPNSRHKKLKSWTVPADMTVEERAKELAGKYPKMVVLNTLSLDGAVEEYQRRRA